MSLIKLGMCFGSKLLFVTSHRLEEMCGSDLMADRCDTSRLARSCVTKISHQANRTACIQGGERA